MECKKGGSGKSGGEPKKVYEFYKRESSGPDDTDDSATSSSCASMISSDEPKANVTANCARPAGHGIDGIERAGGAWNGNTNSCQNSPASASDGYGYPAGQGHGHEYGREYRQLPLDPPWTDYRSGAQMLRSFDPKSYSPCVLDRTGWENFYLTLPLDYDIKNDPKFDCKKSTYTRLMNVDAPVPEPTTAEMLRTGYCGPDQDSLTRPTIIRNIDKRPEPAYRIHLSDRTAFRYMDADPLEGVLPAGRYGDTMKARSVTQRDFKWRRCCVPPRPKKDTFERKVHRYAKTDLHGQEHVNKVVKFNDGAAGRVFEQKLMKLKKAYLWPVSPITGEAVGGHLLYYKNDPCIENRKEIWPCGEKDNSSDCNPIIIPEDRCQVLADKLKSIPRTRERHFHAKSYLDMRYPIRNYECWEEVPGYCEKPEHFPTECYFKSVQANAPPPQKSATDTRPSCCR